MQSLRPTPQETAFLTRSPDGSFVQCGAAEVPSRLRNLWFSDFLGFLLCNGKKTGIHCVPAQCSKSPASPYTPSYSEGTDTAEVHVKAFWESQPVVLGLNLSLAPCYLRDLKHIPKFCRFSSTGDNPAHLTGGAVKREWSHVCRKWWLLAQHSANGRRSGNDDDGTEEKVTERGVNWRPGRRCTAERRLENL